MLTGLDYVVIVLYLGGVAALGILAGGKQRNTSDYFLGGRNIPWIAICFSIVATETSTLTVIGIPAIAYGGSLTFFQLTLGYLVGRLLVSMYLLPRYFEGRLETAYGFLGKRYGDGMRATASVTFLITRLLADGVRLFATAIPLKVVAEMAGLSFSYMEIILVIGLITVAYTLIGGIKAVVWMDVVQMILYIGGAVWALIILMNSVPGGWWSTASAAGKTIIFDFSFDKGLVYFLTQPYTFVTAFVGGIFLSMASHGTDQLIVQRLLACRSLKDGRKALIGSAFLVMAQFALFLGLGLLLWSYYGGASVDSLGLTRADEVFPRFIVEGMPAGISGLMLAGILAAAMSTLSSSLNALASSSLMDLYERLIGAIRDERKALRFSRWLTLFWGLVFIIFANLFENRQNPVVELGLSIASFTYGGLLGIFLLGLLNSRTRQRDAIVGMLVSLAAMVAIIYGVHYSAAEGWVWAFQPSAAEEAEREFSSVAWPWYTVIGTLLTLAVGSLMALRHTQRSKTRR